MRLFSALVSVAEEGRDDALLRTLEAAQAPEIHASEALLPPRRAAFVPTNEVQKDAKHATLVARTNSEREWARAVPRSPRIWYRWPGLALAADARAQLENLCRRVPYLGRSTSPALVELVEEEPADCGRWVPIGPDRARRGLEQVTTVRAPFPGALDALRAAWRAKYREGGAGYPWEIGVGIDYGVERPGLEEPTIAAGPYSALVTLSLEGHHLDGRHAARVAAAFRQALLSRAERHISTLHGHHDGDVVQCAALPLLFVDHERADGHLLGIGLAIPDLPRDELGVVSRALPAAGEVMEVTAGPLGVLRLRRLTPLDASRSSWGLQPERWTQPARSWATAVPVVFDRYLKRGTDIEAEVRRAVANSRLPDPEAVLVSRYPLLRGAPSLAPTDTVRRAGDTAVRPYRHVALKFRERVRGPVVVGSMRHYGLGLFAPLREE
jgi:CRISPR-associated protein Csb2